MEAEPIISTMVQTNSVLKMPQIDFDGNIKSIKLEGKYETSNEESVDIITINSSEVKENEFSIDLGTLPLNEVLITTISTIDLTEITFSDLVYKIEYYDDITAGFIANSTNTILNNIINKSNVYGNYISSGFIGEVKEKLEMYQGYNTGNIINDYMSSGIIGEIKNNTNDVEISNIYNNGIIAGKMLSSFIGNALNNTGIINIEKSLNVTLNYPIYSVNNSTINIINSYSTNELNANIGVVNGSFIQILNENILKKETLIPLEYNEFISFNDVNENFTNAWIYEENMLPILYIDDLNNPIAILNINKYSWDNLSTELNYINIEKSLNFSIEEISIINPIKEKYYYITPSKVALSKEELDKVTTWIPYTDNVEILESGYYVIYAKVIGYDDKITYINSDIIALDIEGKQKNITMDEYSWDSFKTKVSDIYTNKEINVSITAHDSLVPIDNIQYYISTKIINEDAINQITEWTTYTEPILIKNKGKYIIYAKIIDVEQNITYINTDFIIYDGYTQNVTLGNSSKTYNSNYITNKSLFRINFESDFELDFKEGYTHNLISNILLPLGTELMLIDKSSNKIYKKIIDKEEDIYGYNDSCNGLISCTKYATYKFETFKEIGTNLNLYYDESINYGKTITNEKYTLIIDFKNTNIVENYYDVLFSLVVRDNNDNDIYKTLNNTISNINIYSSSNNLEILTNHVLNNDYNYQTINYNSDSQLNINLSNSINYTSLNGKNIIDTLYENKKVGLLIKIYDIKGKELDKKYLDNILFEVNDNEYFANSKNEIRINLGSAIDENINTLKIKTRTNSSDLDMGTYYIKINKFISKDGYYYDSLLEEQITIPLVVEEKVEYIPNYNFDVSMNEESIILDKDLDKNIVSFNILYAGSFTSPTIKISLYEKEKMTAYDQQYKLVDLQKYTDDLLEKSEENKYNINIFTTQFNLNLVNNRFNSNGYKYVFELYDGNKKINQIEKYFIVK